MKDSKTWDRWFVKSQNLPELLRLMVDSSPTQGRRCICDLITMADETDPLPGKIVEGIRTNSGLQEIAIAEFPEEEGRIHY